MGTQLFIGILTACAALIAAIAGLITATRAKRTLDTSAKIHILVNSSMGSQLRLSMLQSRRLFEITYSDSDKDLCEEAERLYVEHMRKQSVVDQIGTR